MSIKKKILVFGASNSKASINRKLAIHAAQQIDGAKLDILDLNDFEMPIYSIDREKEHGIPNLAHNFKKHIAQADGIIISFAEHNSSYSAAYKNIYDWVSRIEKDVWLQKPMLLLATSPGGRGAKTVLTQAVEKYSRDNQSSIVSFSLPSFYVNFDEKNGILDEHLNKEFDRILSSFMESL